MHAVYASLKNIGISENEFWAVRDFGIISDCY